MANPNWVKGMQSPNPGGRPKQEVEIKELLLEMAEGNHEYFARTLLMLIDQTQDHGIRFQALKLACEYIYGKPKQSLEVKGKIEVGLGQMFEAIDKERKLKLMA